MNSSYGKIGADSFDVLPGSKFLSLLQSIFQKSESMLESTCENYILKQFTGKLKKLVKAGIILDSFVIDYA